MNKEIPKTFNKGEQVEIKIEFRSLPWYKANYSFSTTFIVLEHKSNDVVLVISPSGPDAISAFYFQRVNPFYFEFENFYNKECSL